jgi:DNA polymerase III epsilon subunit-like protein
VKKPFVPISVDIEADGPVPGKYSMIALGAVVIEPGLSRTFRRLLCPLSIFWIPEALAVSGYTREQTLAFDSPSLVMTEFGQWLGELDGRPQFISDNAGFDWQFVNYYFHCLTRGNPFGFSSISLTSLYKGFQKDMRRDFRKDGLRKTKHTHDPLDDAKGNAEVWLELQALGLKP